MEIIRNLKKGYFELEGEVYFKLFDRYIKIFIMDKNTEFAELCAKYLNNLSDEIITTICEASIRYCNDHLYDIGQPPIIFAKPQDILQLIYPSALSVPINENMNPVIDMELNCEWEPEQGIQLIIRDNKVLYVGRYNGVDPYGDDYYFEDSSGNYVLL